MFFSVLAKCFFEFCQLILCRSSYFSFLAKFVSVLAKFSVFSKFYYIDQVISVLAKYPKILIRLHFCTFKPNGQSKGKLANWVDPDEML